MFRRADPKLDRLNSIPLLRGCTQGQLETVAELTAFRTYEPRDILVEEDAPSSALFVIVDGSVDVTSGDVVVANLGPGSVLGESAILDWWVPPKGERSRYETGRRTATVTASADAPVEVLVVEPAGFERLRDELPSVARRLVDEIRQRFRTGEPEPSPGRD